MVPQKIKILTLEHGLLWNTIILKSEPPYCAFTFQVVFQWTTQHDFLHCPLVLALTPQE
jgi:hypothetical protein